MWEIYCTVVTNTKLHVLLPKAERDAFVKALENDFRSVVDATCNVNVEHAEANNPVDRKNILDAVDRDVGAQELNERTATGLREGLYRGIDAIFDEWEEEGRDTLRLEFRVARLYQEHNELEHAEHMFNLVLHSHERMLLATVENLADVYERQGKLDSDDFLRQSRERMAEEMHARKLAYPLTKLVTDRMFSMQVEGPDMLEEMSARRLSLSSPLGRGGKETPRD